MTHTSSARSSRPTISRSGGGEPSPVAALAVMSLAFGFVGVAVGQPQLLDHIGSSLVGLMTDDLGSDQLTDGPTDVPKDKEPGNNPATERR